MSVGFPLNITLPTSGQVQWDGTLNTALQALIDTVEAKVTADGLDIQSSLDLQGNYLIDVKGLKFSATTNDGTARQLFWKSDGELYAEDGNGHEVQLTLGGFVIAGSGSIQGIQGTSAQVVYSTGGGKFTFTTAPGQYATLETGDLQVHQGSASSYTDIKSSPVLGSTYNLTLPSTPPAVTSLVTIDSTGSLASTLDPSVSSVTASNSLLTNVRMTGPEPASGYGLLVANQTGSVSSIQSGTFEEWIDIAIGQAYIGSVSYGLNGWAWPGTAGAAVHFPLRVNVGDQIQSIVFTTAGIGTTTGTLIFRGNGSATNSAVIAQKTFNATVACTMSNGAATMTGTLPWTPGVSGPNTGSYVFQASSPNNTENFATLKVTWLKKLI